ncbi:MAG TPA: MBL fold metallo-hydrolase [Candidatus Limnocylindria bacterium]|nr:MBL fold metallo-hydrolase [Candidatus Limnocylindria bacterium]
MRIRFWGTRGSIPTPGQRTVRYGGNTACVEVRADDGSLLILDAGTGLRELGLSMNGSTSVEMDLVLSHLHWDHIQGIPFFRPAYDPRNKLRIHGPKQQKPLRDLLGLGMDDPFFPVDLDALPVQLSIHDVPSGAKQKIGKFDVRTARIFHPAPALAYRIASENKVLVYATDTEDPFSGEVNPVIALAKGADTLIHDAQFLDHDFKRSWGHSTVAKALEVAIEARVKRLVLYHHDPDRSDEALDTIEHEAQERAEALAPGLEVIAASEGLELEV